MVRIVVSGRFSACLLVVAGAILLAWPAMLNGYPLLFSDTHAFLVQAGQPRMVWDKPWIYGPFLRMLHWNATLWLPLAAQALLMAHLLYLVGRVFGGGLAWWQVAVLALGSAAPWFASLLMPDIFAPACVLCLALLARAERLGRGERAWVAGLGMLAVASHLSHLPLAAALALALRRRLAWLPLGGAVALLLASNVVGFGAWSLSPHGAVFALARLVADGPAAETIRAACPQAGWHLCAWADRLPGDADAFLWDGAGPVWSDPGGPAALAPEAGAILRATLLRDPLGVAAAVGRNAARQLAMLQLGDTLGPEHLRDSVLGSLRAWFPPAEIARFFASRQMHDGLRPVAAALAPLHMALLLAGAVWCLWHPRRELAGLVLLAVLVNAAVTGGLSGPHDRYQARIAWLLLLPPLLDSRLRGYRRALRAA